MDYRLIKQHFLTHPVPIWKAILRQKWSLMDLSTTCTLHIWKTRIDSHNAQQCDWKKGKPNYIRKKNKIFIYCIFIDNQIDKFQIKIMIKFNAFSVNFYQFLSLFNIFRWFRCIAMVAICPLKKNKSNVSEFHVEKNVKLWKCSACKMNIKFDSLKEMH